MAICIVIVMLEILLKNIILLISMPKPGDKIIVMTSRPFGQINHTNGVEILEIKG